MRGFSLLLALCLWACPAWAGFTGPNASVAPAITSAAPALEAPEGTTCVLTGTIVNHLTRDRYTFKDDTGSIEVNIPPHVFGALDVTPANTVKITGEIRGKRDPNRLDGHLGVRYIEMIK